VSRAERLFVWTGGALFVSALAVCAASFLLVWGRSGSGAVNWSAAAIDSALLLIFASHHSLFARDWVKTRVARLVPDRLLRSVYVWTASVLLMAVCGAWQRVGGELYRAAGWRAAVHAAVQLAGVWLIARSVSAIDGLELAGIRAPGPAAELQTRGPYRCVRHPLYLGWLLVVFAPAHLTGDRLLFAVATTTYLIVAIPWEERALSRAFGSAYDAYAHTVRWRLVPFLY
jgi:hypothetical protein